MPESKPPPGLSGASAACGAGVLVSLDQEDEGKANRSICDRAQAAMEDTKDAVERVAAKAKDAEKKIADICQIDDTAP